MSLRASFDYVIKKWFDGVSTRPFLEHIISELERNWNSSVFVIEAPTGYGKSTISASLAYFSEKYEFKCILSFPLRTLLEDQFFKFTSPKKEIIEKKKIGKRYMHNPESRYLIKPVTFTTIDTLSLTLFGIPPEYIDKVVEEKTLGHYLFSWSSVVFSNIVLDEVHLLTDTTKSLSFLMALMGITKKFDQKLILMSATIPKSLKQIIRKYHPKTVFIDFKPELDSNFCKKRLKKSYKFSIDGITKDEKFTRIRDWILKSEFRRVIVVFNTVKEAMEFYDLIKDIINIFDGNILLIHSRFTEKDREKKNEVLQKIKNADRYLIISTQVIEAGVDISSNLFITDIAPANSLIQRLGRFLRYDDENEGEIIIWFETDGEKLIQKNSNYKVYDLQLTERTLKWLIRHGNKTNFHLPHGGKCIGYKELIDNVYSEDDFKVDGETIKKFDGIFLHLENASKIAVKRFFEMEGSFVREGIQIPVVTEDFVNVNPDHLSIKESVVPVSIKAFIRRDVLGVLKKENGKIEFVRKEYDSWLKNLLESPRITPAKLLEYIFKRDVIAFVIKAKYDSTTGLRSDIDE